MAIPSFLVRDVQLDGTGLISNEHRLLTRHRRKQDLRHFVAPAGVAAFYQRRANLNRKDHKVDMSMFPEAKNRKRISGMATSELREVWSSRGAR